MYFGLNNRKNSSCNQLILIIKGNFWYVSKNVNNNKEKKIIMQQLNYNKWLSIIKLQLIISLHN